MTTDDMTNNVVNPQAEQFLLLDLAKCQACGAPLTVRQGNGEQPSRYGCRNAVGLGGKSYDVPEIETRHLDELVVDHMVTKSPRREPTCPTATPQRSPIEQSHSDPPQSPSAK